MMNLPQPTRLERTETALWLIECWGRYCNQQLALYKGRRSEDREKRFMTEEYWSDRLTTARGRYKTLKALKKKLTRDLENEIF